MGTKPVKTLTKLISSGKAKIAVIGLGQAGLPTAAVFAKSGFNVTGYDIDRRKVADINRGKSRSDDICDDELKKLIINKKLVAKDSLATVSSADIVIIAVPTFITKQEIPNLDIVSRVSNEVAEQINKPTLIILESTVYPGATEEILNSSLSTHSLKLDEDFFLAYSPSRIDLGNKEWPITKIPKIVAGLSEESLTLATCLYSLVMDSVVVAGSIKTAEMTKLYENSYRAVNIAFADGMHMLCHSMGLDIWEIIDLASTKPFGFSPFYPGPGIGGECIPVVPLYIAWKVREYGMRAGFIELASEIIDKMPEFFINYLSKLLNKDKIALKRAKILLIGVAYKKNTSDIRKSPAKAIIRLLRTYEADVSYYDPFVPDFKTIDFTLKSKPLSAKLLREQDAVVIITDHSRVDYGLVVNNSRLILDTRNALAEYTAPHIHRR